MATTTIHNVLLCLASNHQQERNMAEARQLLSELLGDLHLTSEHWTEPVGTNLTKCLTPCEMYLNQLAAATTTLGAEELNQRLKEIEQQLGRTHDGSGVVTIDIDLLQYDDTRYHQRDWERDYVKNLLVEL